MLEPGRFRLASTMEAFDMPHDLLGMVHDKSTWARRPRLPEHRHRARVARHLTFELSQPRARQLIQIEAGTPIAQIIFHLLDARREALRDGKYQDQKAGPQPAIFEPELPLCVCR